MSNDASVGSSSARSLGDRILRQLRERGGFAAAIRTTGPELARLYDSSGAICALRDGSQGRGFLWTCGELPATSTYSEPPPATMDRYFSGPAGDWILHRAGERSKRTAWCLTVHEKGDIEPSAQLIRQVSRLTHGRPLTNLISVQIPPVREWTGRFLLINAKKGDPQSALASIANLVRYIGPSMLAKHDTRQLRERVRAEERASLARELHDGVIQSLLSVGVRLHVLRGRAGLSGTTLGDLRTIEHEIHDQVVSLRRLIETRRPDDLEPAQLFTHIQAIVQQFERDAGISVTLDADRGEVAMTSSTCAEIIRVLQEALANIRRHSGARSVRIAICTSHGDCRMTIADDGRGFPFEGRLTLDELERTLHGPRVIKERVRALGGDLTIESGTSGARLEIRFPAPTGYAVA